MVKIWYRLITKGLKTIADVPTKYKKNVQALLESAKESEG